MACGGDCGGAKGLGFCKRFQVWDWFWGFRFWEGILEIGDFGGKRLGIWGLGKLVDFGVLVLQLVSKKTTHRKMKKILYIVLF